MVKIGENQADGANIDMAVVGRPPANRRDRHWRISGEAASVGDSKAYAPVAIDSNISNVGYAATGGSVSGGTAQQFRAPLSAPFAQGAVIAPSPGGGSLTWMRGLRRHRRHEFYGLELAQHQHDNVGRHHYLRQRLRYGRQRVRHSGQHGTQQQAQP